MHAVHRMKCRNSHCVSGINRFQAIVTLCYVEQRGWTCVRARNSTCVLHDTKFHGNWNRYNIARTISNEPQRVDRSVRLNEQILLLFWTLTEIEIIRRCEHEQSYCRFFIVFENLEKFLKTMAILGAIDDLAGNRAWGIFFFLSRK